MPEGVLTGRREAAEPRTAAVRPERAAAPRLLNRNVLLLWVGQAVSQVGSGSFFVAMMFWLKHETGSAAWMGGLAMTAKLVGILAGPLGGVAADRFSRRRVMVACDLADGALVLGLGALLMFRPGSTAWILGGFAAACIVNEITNAFFIPAQMAALPDMVPPQRLAAANTVDKSLHLGSDFLGMVLGSALLGMVGAGAFFVANGLSYFVSLACLALIVIPARHLAEGRTGRPAGARLADDLRQGCRFIWEHKGLLHGVLGGLGLAVALAVVGVMAPFYVEDVLGRTAAWFGYLAAAGGAGSFAGMLAAGWVPCDGKARLCAVSGALFAFAAGIVALALVRHAGAALAIAFCGSVAAGFLIVQTESLIQLSVPTELRGRVLSLIMTAQVGAFGMGMGMGGLLGDRLHHDVGAMYLACGVAVALVGAAVLASRPARGFLSLRIEAPSR